MLCPNCESVNRDGAKFCDECGFPLSGSGTRSAYNPYASGGQSAVVPEQAGDGLRGNGESAEKAPSDNERDIEKTEEGNEGIEPEHEGAPDDVACASSGNDESETREEQAADEENGVEVGPDEGFGQGPRTEDETEQDALAALETAPATDAMLEQGAADEPAENAALQGETEASENPEPDEPQDGNGLQTGSEPVASGLDKLVHEESYYQNAADETVQIPYGEIEADRFQQTQETGPAAWAPDITMEMPRIGEGDQAQSRDFVTSSAKKQKKSFKPVVFAVIALIVVAAAGLGVTYALGIWGGKMLPNVTGMTESDARTTLQESGFSVRSLQVRSDDTEGLVLLMDPGAGTRVDEGSEVVIHIATARIVPDVKGKTSEQAIALLKENGYENITVTNERSDEPENTVLSMNPEPGTRMKSSGAITITVAEPFRVPDISGLDAYSAVEAIQDVGLSSSIVYVETETYIDGTVLGTTPEAGTVVEGGSYVSVNVARARGAELEGLTQSLLAPGSTVTLGMYNYEIVSLKSVKYQGNNTVTFAATGRPKITFFGETLYASNAQNISGEVVWSASNQVISIS